MREIFHRTSIRKFENRPVEQEKILAILKAAMQSPSAGNQQPWEFYVVTDRTVLEQLSKISEYSGSVANAPAAIVNVYQSEGLPFQPVAQMDMSICTEHEWLTVDELGLGGVWIGVAPFEDRMKKAKEILRLPEGKEVFSILPFGYPEKIRKQKDRFHKERIHWI